MPSPIDIKYSYADVPTVREFAQSDAFIRGLMGPFGSGKSSGCVVELIRRGLAQKPGPDGVRRTRWAVIRNTYRQLEDTTIKTVLQWLPELYFGKFYTADHRYVIKGFAGAEIEILFRALDRPDHVANLLSMELTGAWINEAREIPWAIIEAVQGRVGRYPAVRDGGPSWFGVFMDTNPPDGDSKWFKFFEEEDHSKSVEELAKVIPGITVDTYCRIFKQPSGLSDKAENLSNLQPGYYQRLAIGKGEEWIKVYIKGDYGFVIDGKPIFGADYNDQVHCQDVNPIEGARIYRGWDFGLTPACSLSQLLPDGRWLIFDEIIATSMGIERFGNQVLEYCTRVFPRGAQFTDYGDPAGMQRAQTDEKTCFEILNAKGIDIEPGEQNLTLRLESVRKPMNTMVAGEAQLVVNPRCKVTRKAFMGGYQYRRLKTGGEKYTNDPDKNQFSHIMDAAQYTATRLFGGGLTSHQTEESDWPSTGYGSDVGRSAVTGY